MKNVIFWEKIVNLIIKVLFFVSLSFGKDFIYNSKFFRAAEMIHNLSEDKAYIHLLLREDKEFDIKLVYSEREDLFNPKVVIYHRNSSHKKNVAIILTDLKKGKRFFYQIYCREKNNWEIATPIRNFFTLGGNLSDKDTLKVILVGDSHTFDDADFGNKIIKDEELKKLRLTGDYVNVFLERLFKNPFWVPKPNSEESKLIEGFCWAKAIKQILEESPNFLFDLGDLTGIGAEYRWDGLGLSREHAKKDYEEISKILWERTRRIYSGLSPYLPIYLVSGNHDGEEKWNPIKFKARKWKNEIFPMPKFDSSFKGDLFSDRNYYAFTWGKNQDGKGGVLFVVLDVCSYSGSNRGLPKKLKNWSLGKEQFQWLEEVLKKSQVKYKFILFHHVLGGWRRGSSPDEKKYCYGKGPLFTRDDYRLIGIKNLNEIEQIKLTEMARKYNVNMFIYGHDHIFHLKSIGKNTKGDEMYALCVGSPKYGHDKRWWEEKLWQVFYGHAYRKPLPRFYGVPGYTVLKITNEYIEIKFICSAYAPYPEFNNYPAYPKDVLFSKKLYFSN